VPPGMLVGLVSRALLLLEGLFIKALWLSVGSSPGFLCPLRALLRHLVVFAVTIASIAIAVTSITNTDLVSDGRAMGLG